MTILIMPFIYEEGREYCFATVRLSVGMAVGWSVGPPMVSVHYLHRGLKYCNEIWNIGLS